MMEQKNHVSRWTVVGFAVILTLLVSLPIIAFATGALNGSPQYTLMRAVPAQGDGAYLAVNDGTHQGVVQLYAWNFPLDDFPNDAPVFNSSHITALVVSQRGIDDTTRYHLFQFDDDTPIELDAQTTPTKITFTLRAPLTNGNYMVDMPKSGLSSDRQYLYFRVDGAVKTLPIFQAP